MSLHKLVLLVSEEKSSYFRLAERTILESLKEGDLVSGYVLVN